MTTPALGSAIEPHAELFPHDADVGVRGIGPTRDSAFEQAALALTSAVTDPAGIASQEAIEVTCEAPDDAYLLVDWLNALIYEMSVRRLVFGRFAVSIEGNRLYGRAWGEPVDRARHMPTVEPKGATLTAPGSRNASSTSEQAVKPMDLSRLHRISNWQWRVDPEGKMRVPAVLYGDEGLIAEMDDKVLEQIGNVACLPGIVDAAYTMPDAHWGYGFPIGGVAAFDPDGGGVVSAGGVGFDISCGVRTLLTGLKRQDLESCKEALADSLFRTIPAGVGSTGKIVLDEIEMDRMLEGGARWAIGQGRGCPPMPLCRTPSPAA